MNKLLIVLITMIYILLPYNVFADNNDDLIETKYYKTIIYRYGYNDSKSIMYNTSSKDYVYTLEISANEYNLAPSLTNHAVLNGGGYAETNYKKMTTSISKNGNKYKYQVLLNWKSIPITRSYDIIGIGYYKSVKLSGSTNFLLTYNSITSKTADIITTSTGTSATFKIPSGNISSLSARLSFNVEKNVNADILEQVAAGDYAHSTTSISLSLAKKT